MWTTTAVLCLALWTTACSTQGLSLLVDDRLSFVTPQERAQVRLPVTIDWDVAAIDGLGSFGVLIDRPPPPPGETFAWFARDDAACQRDVGCPNDDWFAVRGIGTTTQMSWTIDRLSRPADDSRRELHELTVILLDPQGRRIGESAWSLQFEVDRSDG